MISTARSLYKIDLRLNKLATNDHQAIPVENKIFALNTAQIKLIKLKLNENNIYREGFDAFKKRYEDLQNLVETSHEHPLTLTLADPQLNKWVADLSELEPKYMFYVDSYAIADKDVCKNHVMYVNKDLTKHADITVLLANNFVNPSFEYQETFCTLSNNKYEVYGDGSFTFQKAYISYIRYPQKIDSEGYINEDNTPSINQDSELADYLEDELIDIAVEELAMSTENLSAAQASKERMSTNE